MPPKHLTQFLSYTDALTRIKSGRGYQFEKEEEEEEKTVFVTVMTHGLAACCLFAVASR